MAYVGEASSSSRTIDLSETSWKSLTRCHGVMTRPLSRKISCLRSSGHCILRTLSGSPPCLGSDSCTSAMRFLISMAWRTSRMQLADRK